MTKNETAKEHFLITAKSYLGLSYKWGGDDPSGFDCSGFVLECLKSIGLINEHDDFSAHALMRYLLAHTSINQFPVRKIDNPAEGVLLFSLNRKKHAYHVVICLDAFYQIGASGGDSAVITESDASRKNAFIKIRPIRRKEDSFCIISIF